MKAEDFKCNSGVLNSSSLANLNEIKFTRGKCEYENLSKKFRHAQKDLSRQYCHIYAVRLAKMREILIKRAQQKWGEKIPVKKLVELQDGEKCIISGTLFKHQELKPSILKEISEEFQLVPQKQLSRFVSDKDEVVLEDELQRVRLIGNINIQNVVTGIACAALGFEDESGKFHVEEICWAGPGQVPSSPLKRPGDNRYLILISGLDLAHNASTLLPLRLFVDWVTGWLGEPSEQENVSKVAHIILAGNIIRGSSQDKDGKVINTGVSSASDILSTIQLADDILTELTESVEVDLMPGEFDPTNFTLPQQPIHCCMFPKAWRQKTLRSVTNPYCARIGGRIVTGTSGQPVDDIGRYSEITNPIEALEGCLQWGHLAPTAPDTLSCYPYYEDDPFIIDCQPDIIFAGNQEEFATKDVELRYDSNKHYKTMAVCIPKFSKSGICAVVNLSTLECTPIKFKVSDETMDLD